LNDRVDFDDDERENQFDEQIQALHAMIVGQIPATFYQLLEIAVDLQTALKPAFDASEQIRAPRKQRGDADEGSP
jgi:hypothetical protein